MQDHFSLSFILHAVLQTARLWHTYFDLRLYEDELAFLKFNSAIYLPDPSLQIIHTAHAHAPLSDLTIGAVILSGSVQAVQNIVYHHLQRLLCWRGRQTLQCIQRLQVQHLGSGTDNYAGEGGPLSLLPTGLPHLQQQQPAHLTTCATFTSLCMLCTYGAGLLCSLDKYLTTALPEGAQLTMSASWRARCRAAWMPPPK